MKYAYVPTYQSIKTAQVLDGALDASLDEHDFLQTQVKLAAVSFNAYALLRDAATRLPQDPQLTTKEAMVVAVVDAVLSLRDVHVDLGMKLASSGDIAAANLVKLAQAVYVDEVLLEQLSMLEGATKEAAQGCQFLGREYIISLLGEILA